MTKDEKELFERILQEKTSDNKIKRVLEELDRIKELNKSLSEEIRIYKQTLFWKNSHINTLSAYLKKLSLFNWIGILRFKKMIQSDVKLYEQTHQDNIFDLKMELRTLWKLRNDKRRN